ncbi:MAG: ATPase, T2SS/T4P/T4SS family [Thermoleophilia bacterium]
MTDATPDAGLVERVRAAAVSEARLAHGHVDALVLRATAERVLARERVILGADAQGAVVQAVVDEALGLGPLEGLLRDTSITEIMVCGPHRVFVERAGRVTPSTARFADTAHLLHVVDRILSPLGRRVDESSPMVDARLPDGSRVNVVVPPLAVDGPALTIRRFGATPLRADDLVMLGTLSAEVHRLLAAAVRAKRNVLVTGGTGSGKTTTLAALASAIPADERVITIEDAAELQLPLPHVVRLESRPPSIEGTGAIPIRALVRNALRMRPDRIVVGEVRGGECLDMLTAMTTGHEGSLSTLHASSPADAIRRLQLLALMGDLELPFQAVADQVAAAIDVIVHQARLPSGRRVVMEVCVPAGPGASESTVVACWDAAGDALELRPAAAAWERTLSSARGAHA